MRNKCNFDSSQIDLVKLCASKVDIAWALIREDMHSSQCLQISFQISWVSFLSLWLVTICFGHWSFHLILNNLVEPFPLDQISSFIVNNDVWIYEMVESVRFNCSFKRCFCLEPTVLVLEDLVTLVRGSYGLHPVVLSVHFWRYLEWPWDNWFIRIINANTKIIINILFDCFQDNVVSEETGVMVEES